MPPLAGVADVGGATSNPYRIGTGVGTRKPAYGISGIASFSTTSSSVGSVSQPLLLPANLQPAAPLQQSMAFQASLNACV